MNAPLVICAFFMGSFVLGNPAAVSKPVMCIPSMNGVWSDAAETCSACAVGERGAGRSRRMTQSTSDPRGSRLAGWAASSSPLGYVEVDGPRPDLSRRVDVDRTPD